MAKVIYFHGFQSKLHDDRKENLALYFSKIIAPSIDYLNEENIFEKYHSIIEKEKPNAIIGSSMGGFLGYFMGLKSNIPCLLFNPALQIEEVLPFIPSELENLPKPYMQISIGMKDQVIDANKTLQYLFQHNQSNDSIKINLRSEKEHPVDIDWFSEELNQFQKLIMN